MSLSTTEVARSWSCVLFDLDGTLTDSAPGITASLKRTFEAIGRPVHTEEELLAYVGPPLVVTLREREDFTEAEAEHALQVYRDFANESDLIDNAVFPGIVGLLGFLFALYTLIRPLLSEHVFRRLGYLPLIYIGMGPANPGIWEETMWVPITVSILAALGTVTYVRGADAAPGTEPDVATADVPATRPVLRSV